MPSVPFYRDRATQIFINKRKTRMRFSKIKKAVITAAAALAGIATLFGGAATASAADITLNGIPDGTSASNYSYAKVGTVAYGNIDSAAKNAKEAHVTGVETAFQSPIVTAAHGANTSLPSEVSADNAVKALQWYLSSATAAQQQAVATTLAGNSGLTAASGTVSNGSLTLSGLADDSVYVIKDGNGTEGLALLVLTGDANVTQLNGNDLGTIKVKPKAVTKPTKIIESINGVTKADGSDYGDNVSIQNGDTVGFKVSHTLTAAELSANGLKPGDNGSYINVEFSDDMSGLTLLDDPMMKATIGTGNNATQVTITTARDTVTDAQKKALTGSQAILEKNSTGFNLYFNGAAIAQAQGWYSTTNGMTNPDGSVPITVTYSARATNVGAETGSNAGKHTNSATTTIGTNPSQPNTKTMYTLTSFKLTKEDISTHAPLKDAVFALTYVNGSTTKYVHVTQGSDGTYTVNGMDDNAGTPATNTVTTGTDGTVTINGLGENDGGHYVLTETKAPTGYLTTFMPSVRFQTKLNTPSTTGNTTNYSYTVTDIHEDNNLTDTSVTDPSKVVIYNAKTINQLPATGAAGITFFVILGLLLLIIAGAIALVAVRNRHQARLAQTSAE